MKRPTAAIGIIAGVALAVAGLQIAGAGPSRANPAGTGVVISEIYTSGGAVYDADYVELYNPTSAPIGLSGMSLQIRNATDAVLGTVPLSGSVPAKHAFLVQMTSAGATGQELPTPDLVAGTNGGSWIDLTGSSQVILGTASSYPTGNLAGVAGVVDAIGQTLGTGGSGSYETAPAPEAPLGLSKGTGALPGSGGVSLQRTAAGADTDDNAADFSWSAPSPCDSSCTTAQLARTSSSVSVPAVTMTEGDSSPANNAVTATVIGEGGGTPTGVVTLSSDDPLAQELATGNNVNASGTVALHLPVDLFPGTYSVTATYWGDATYQPSITTFTLTVNAGSIPTSVSATDAATHLVPGGPAKAEVPITVTSTGGGTPTGAVSLWYGGAELSGSQLASGTATIDAYAEQLLPGANTLTVRYHGDATYAPSTSTVTVTTPLAYSDISIAAPGTTYGTSGKAAVAVSAEWSTASGAPQGTLSGDVTLTGAGDPQTKAIDADGNVSFDLPATLPAGSYHLTASYEGNDQVRPSTGTATFTVAAGSTGTVTPPGGDHTATPPAAQQQLAHDQAKLKKAQHKLKKAKKAYKKAHGAKKAKLKKKVKKLKKKVKKDKARVKADR